MINPSAKNLVLTAIILCSTLLVTAQAPFTGTSQFRKFSVGINAGALRPSIVSGGSNDFTKPLYSFGYGANVKYQFTHHFGLQADFLKGKLKGNNENNYWNGVPATNRTVSSFETDMAFAASLSAVYAFGNMNWLSTKTSIVPYVTAGGGLTHYKPVTVARGTTTPVPYFNGNSLHNFFVPVSVGLKFKLSDMVNLDLGYRANFVDNDNFDGTTTTHANVHKDKFSYGFVGVESAFGKKTQKQLIFDNPAVQLKNSMQVMVNHLQGQVDTLNTRLSTVDSDGDGVADQFDKEPNTPTGCPVDFRGVMKDTDGDGVVDCKDKELITSTECQPVDADGVGKCPQPACCLSEGVKDNACSIGDLPSISFKGNTLGINSGAQAMLAIVSSKLKLSADCSITVTGYPATTKASQSLCTKRVEAIKSYLMEKEGISAERIVTNCEPGGGDMNTIDISGHMTQ